MIPPFELELKFDDLLSPISSNTITIGSTPTICSGYCTSSCNRPKLICIICKYIECDCCNNDAQEKIQGKKFTGENYYCRCCGARETLDDFKQILGIRGIIEVKTIYLIEFQ